MSLELELLWFVVVLVGVIAIGWSSVGSVGLSLAYLISLGFIHFWGGLIHALPWYSGGEADFTQLGFHQFAWAITGFALGRFALATLVSKHLPAPHPANWSVSVEKLVLISGVVAYTLFRTLLAGVPSFGAVASCGGALIVAGLCLSVSEGLRHRKYGRLVLVFAALGFLPFFTIVSSGFLGYGAAAAMVVVTFVTAQARPRIIGGVVLLVTVYIGFCTFMTYMRDRGDIRDEAWDEDSSFSQRVERLKTTFTKFELVDLKDQDQLERIEGRLNQNDLVGRAVYMLDNGSVDFARGETFRMAAISLVPRIFWPSKPVVAGSPDIVSYFTGESFAAGTSVGIGQVMEGYVNYGTWGIIAVFVVMGLALGVVDQRAAQFLEHGDQMGFIVWFVPGVGLLQPGGSLVEVTATVAASIVLVQALRFPFAVRAKKAAAEAASAPSRVRYRDPAETAELARPTK